MDLDNVFHFGMGQQVKVQVMGVVVYGTILLRLLKDTKHGVRLYYEVKFPYGTSYDTIEPTQEYLIETQKLKVGIQND